MKTSPILRLACWSCLLAVSGYAATNQILGWNNLGMHCMDSDYSVFSILPPYNTIEAQLIVNGQLVTASNGYTVTYRAVADPGGSFNSTAMGKGNYYTYAQALYGANLGPEQGLAGWNMPGTNNTPQNMWFENTNHPAAGVQTPVNWWRAEGIPISPYDDALNKNPYPMMRLIALNGSTPIATNDIVLPVSDEMDCRACHASGSGAAALPDAGWVWDGIQERDFRLNILRLHDEHQFAQHGSLYQAALAARGFNPAGLYRSVTADGKPILCAACHASEALGAPSYATIPPLTASVHAFHAHVNDPLLNTNLDSAANRSACYRCHPGSTTRCLRGAMGGAIATDGSMEMQCQSCHGNMSAVGSADRVGWFMEPKCQSCHSGTATSNNGQMRYTSCFTNLSYGERIAVNQTFATQSNTPAAGLSLYRFSAGHGGLQCEACHGSTHAEFPSTHVNDNVRNIKLQGHVGVMAECTSCHVATPPDALGGPHGMHAVGSPWVNSHHSLLESNLVTRAQCQPCHGSDYRGTMLSRMQADRTLSAFGSKLFFRGSIIGCYNCHRGPDDDNSNTNAAPAVFNVAASTSNDQPVAMPISVTGAGAALRIISQTTNGSVGLSNNVATYFPNPGFVGMDTFTFAAYDGSKNSNLGTGTVTVVQGPYSIGVTAHAPPGYPAGWPVVFAAVPTVTNSSGPVTYDWDFGDGSPHSASQFPTHVYAASSNYFWTVSATLSDSVAFASGSIGIGSPEVLSIAPGADAVTIAWPDPAVDALLETSGTLGPGAHWTWATNSVGLSSGVLSITRQPEGNEFFRLRQAW